MIKTRGGVIENFEPKILLYKSEFYELIVNLRGELEKSGFRFRSSGVKRLNLWKSCLYSYYLNQNRVGITFREHEFYPISIDGKSLEDIEFVRSKLEDVLKFDLQEVPRTAGA